MIHGTPLAGIIFSSLPRKGDATDLSVCSRTAGVEASATFAGDELCTSLRELAQRQHFDMKPPPWVRYPSGMYQAVNSRLEAQLKAPPTKKLNKSQMLAIKFAVQERRQLMLVQGPPGTGKTLLAKAIAGEVGFSRCNPAANGVYQFFFGHYGHFCAKQQIWKLS